MFCPISLFILCITMSSFHFCESEKCMKHSKLELLKEIVVRFFSDYFDVRGRSPPKVAFAVRLTKLISNVNVMVLKFDHVLTNEGNGYDKTTGTFTAPVDGMYLFSWNILSHSHQRAHVYLYVNDKYKWASKADDGPQGYDTGSATVVLRLKHGDKVQLRTADTKNYLHSGLTTFTGTLLYQ